MPASLFRITSTNFDGVTDFTGTFSNTATSPYYTGNQAAVGRIPISAIYAALGGGNFALTVSARVGGANVGNIQFGVASNAGTVVGQQRNLTGSWTNGPSLALSGDVIVLQDFAGTKATQVDFVVEPINNTELAAIAKESMANVSDSVTIQRTKQSINVAAAQALPVLSADLTAVHCSAGPYALTLPTGTNNAAGILAIDNATAGGAIALTPAGGQTINQAAAAVSLALGKGAHLTLDGSNWTLSQAN